MTTVVYLGPSLPVREAQSILPAACYRPPAAQADIVSDIEAGDVDTVVLIDGTFRHSLSVWHNEICYAISKGVRVVGASSMGALRAAETAVFGTIGIGVIFEWYRDGVITGDDEVALAHSDADDNYRALSEPLVNIRATIAAAVAAGNLSPHLATLTVDIAKHLYFPNRSVMSILHGLREHGVQANACKAVETCLLERYVDQKREDAVKCLEFVATSPPHARAATSAAFDFSHSYVFETLFNLDRRVSHDGYVVPLQHVAEHVALHHPTFDATMETALHRGLLVFMSSLLGVRPTADEVHEERFRFLEARRLSEGEDVEQWRRGNDLSKDDFERLIGELAAIRALRRWLLGNRGLDRGVRYLLDQLRLDGDYEQWATAAAQETTISAAYADADYSESLLDPPFLVRDHCNATGRRVEATADWAFDAGFEDAEGVVEALRRAAIARDVKRRVDAITEDNAGKDLLAGPPAQPLPTALPDSSHSQ